ncbi:MAG TPA: IS110 family transposase [Arachidicoccus sp.]|nr:IS110 family transposase [Arachidicoccus sp.]
MTVPGIGSITAIALITEIVDFNRFNNPHEYCSYLGMISWEHSSGDTVRTMGMQPRCNKQLRPILIEASWMAIRKDAGLLLYYKKHSARNNKHAIVKVARKLALIAKGVVTRNQPYDCDFRSKIEERRQNSIEIEKRK